MAADTSLSSRGAEFDSRGGRAGTGSWGEPCPLERHEAPIRVGAQLGRQGVQGRERALDRGAVRGGLRGQANPRQRDVEGAQPPAPSPVDEFTGLREEFLL